ncbi:hypothetical protein GW17_00062464 [Ensete ventricosum]|nr:hypothetical protein GW17_00062464 [Ensete ventricosum]
MALVWRADSGSGGYDTGNEALEMKRKCRVWLEGNSGDNKDREEGMKMRATVVVATCAIRRRCRQHWLGVVHAVMFAVAKWEKGDGGCNRSGDSSFWGRTTKDSFIAALVLPTKVVNNCKMVLLAIDGAVVEALGSTSKGRQQC